jgi:hypothetical protein
LLSKVDCNLRKDMLDSSRVVEFLKKSRLHIDKIRYIWSLGAGDAEKSSITQNEFNLLMRLVALDQSAKEVSIKNAYSTEKVRLPHFDGFITPGTMNDDFDELALQFSYRNKSMLSDRKANQEDEFGEFVDSVGVDNGNQFHQGAQATQNNPGNFNYPTGINTINASVTHDPLGRGFDSYAGNLNLNAQALNQQQFSHNLKNNIANNNLLAGGLLDHQVNMNFTLNTLNPSAFQLTNTGNPMNFNAKGVQGIGSNDIQNKQEWKGKYFFFIFLHQYVSRERKIFLRGGNRIR